ncbi:MAG TPA: AraC family transcriptional regulator [Polyangiaceae bacterium]|nr:AraC family transcriptional regulator [Polyangiaceae bacterium]
MDSRELAQQFLVSAVSPPGFELLFDHLSDVYFFVKDAEGRFVRVNKAFLALVKTEDATSIIGKRDHDFFPHGFAENYVRDDKAVLSSGQPLVEKTELVQREDGSIDWFCTTKLPVLDAQSNAIGVCGVTRNIKQMGTNQAQLTTWEPVVELMLTQYGAALDTATLANKVGLSVSQFNRQFRRRFQTSPRDYLTNIRLDAASHLLTTTDLPMSEIAQRTGFYDQSHFTNQFVKRRGMPPTRYRVRYAVSVVRPQPVVAKVS